jgi:hypothetical protein
MTFAAELTRLRALSPARIRQEAKKKGWVDADPDAVLLGFACLANNAPVVRAILTQHPHLLNSPCTWSSWVKSLYKAEGEPEPPCLVHNGLTPLMAACTALSCKVIDDLIPRPGIGLDEMLPRATDEWTAMGLLVRCLLRGVKPGKAKPALTRVQAFLDAGANPFVSDSFGHSPFSMVLEKLAPGLAQGRYPESATDIRIALLDLMVPHLPALENASAAPAGLARIQTLLGHLQRAPYPLYAPAALFLKAHWALQDAPVDNYGQVMVARLLSQGMQVEALVRQVSLKNPDLLVWAESRHLERTLDRGSLVKKAHRL